MSLYAMIQVEDMAIISHNLNDSLDPPAWSAGTYSPLSEVSHNGRIWAAVEETTSQPGTDATWKDIEATNFNKMLEDVIITRTRSTASDNSIRLTVKGSGGYLGLLGMQADFVTINGVQQDVSAPVADMWSYYSTPIEVVQDVTTDTVFRDEVEIIIERIAAPAELGKLFLGRQIYMGELQHDPRQKMTDFSLLERDSFGYVTNSQQRGYSRDIEGELRYPVETAARQFNILAGLRTRPALYVNKTLHLLTYGALRQIEWSAPNNPNSTFNFYIEGYV